MVRFSWLDSLLWRYCRAYRRRVIRRSAMWRVLMGDCVIREFPLNEYLPRVLPDGWTVLQPWGDGNTYATRDGLRVIASGAEYDGREWLHVSLSRKDRLPGYDDMKYVKQVLLGNDRWAAQLFPPVSQHVNIHQFCLHLWCPVTGSLPWPNFGEGGTI